MTYKLRLAAVVILALWLFVGAPLPGAASVSPGSTDSPLPTSPIATAFKTTQPPTATPTQPPTQPPTATPTPGRAPTRLYFLPVIIDNSYTYYLPVISK